MELTGKDIVAIIKAGAEAGMSLIKTKDIELHFEKQEEKESFAHITEDYVAAASGITGQQTTQIEEPIFTPEEQDELYMAQLALENPVEWEDRQINPEKYQN